ncbi:unnamed protein product, partial [Rotaria sp. Silwood2]
MDNSIKFSNNDLIVLEEIIDLLESFYEISIKCQAETIATASMAVPAFVHLLSHLRDIKENIFYFRLNQNHIEENDPLSDPVYFMAAVLDPVFKFYWIQDLRLPANAENRLKQSIIQLILDDISKDTTTSTNNLTDQ